MDFDFDKIVFIEPTEECDIINYLENKYSTTGLFIEKTNGNKVWIIKEDKSPDREWCECAYSEFCIAEVRNGKIEMIILYPSPEMSEYCGFYQMEVCK